MMIIIPARIASTRFPKKILHCIDGIPMVIRTAMQAKNIDEVVIATDSQEVIDIAKKYGFDAVLTNTMHKSGTDRVNEAAAILGLAEDEIVINLQADEPFIESDVIQKVYELTYKNIRNDKVMMNSTYKKVAFTDENDPNMVKVILDAADMALYFSRSLIPYPRSSIDTLNIHLGIYGFSKRMLERFCSLAHAPLEDIEKLEQLRALYHGYSVAMVEVESQSIGIDTPKDLEKISAFLPR